MQVSHKPSAVSVSFDEANLVSSAGLLPVMTLARDSGLHDLADEWLSVPTDKGANAGLKVASLVAGMVAGADSIDDMAVLRHGGMGRLFNACYAPSTLGSFLRAFTFGHVRQLTLSPPASWRIWGPGPRCSAALGRRTSCSWTSMTRSLRSTATPSRVPVTGIPGSAG